jgi:defect-in-organelle-trafficking protein DotD
MNPKNKLILIFLIIASNTIVCTNCANKSLNNNINTNKALSTENCQFNKINNQINNNKITNNNLNNKPNKISNKNNSTEQDPCKDQNINQSIEEQLITSAKSIEKSLANLAASQEMNNIPVLNTAPLITPEGGMGHTADIDWTGPIEPLLQKIAAMTNYNLKVLGSPSPIPIIISITQTKAIIADILKNASLQAGKRVNIVVFPANRIIELRYRFGPYNSKPANNHETN